MLTMYDVLDVCRYIIYYSNQKHYTITNLRLQKTLYFVQSFFLLNKNTACFSNTMEAWNLGPVVPDAYAYYKKYKAGGLFNRPGYKNDVISASDQEYINTVVDALSKYTTYQLVDITHNQSPWLKNYSPYDNNSISTQDLTDFVTGKK